MKWTKGKGKREEAGEEKPWFSQPGFIAAAAFIALILVAGLTLVLVKPGAAPDESATADRADEQIKGAPSPSTASGAETENSVCGLPAGDQTVPITAPTSVRWEFIDTPLKPGRQVAVPVSDTSGPGKIDDTGRQRSCFARSPVGALLAAANALIAEQMGEFDFLINTLNAPGPGQETLRKKNTKQILETRKNDILAQIQGFKLSYYSGSKAEVVLNWGAESKPGWRGQSVYSMIWFENDWKVKTGPDGAIKNSYFDQEEFIPWWGVKIR